MKRTALMSLALTSLALAGCGGGGGGSTPPPAETTRLAPYIGSWSEGCDGHELATMVVARTSADTVNFAAKTQYFANAGCTGAVIGTETASANVTMTYTSSVDSSIVFNAGTAAVPAKIDLVTVRIPQTSFSVTGSGVVHTIINGQPQWCIAFNDGSSTCVHDDGVQAAEGPISAGLYATGSEMYIVQLKGSTYEAGLRLTKQ